MRTILYFCFVPIFTFLYNMDDYFLDGKNRPSVTFIVGEDAEAENRYFETAKRYYLTHNTEGVESFVVDSCRSLLAIQQFLQNQPTRGNKPWGIINIVAHGNEWTGLKLSIVPNVKERVNATTLQKAFSKRVLPNLTHSWKVDRLTQLHVKGCGVGKDLPLLAAMKQAFGGRLHVASPEKFVTYQADNQCYLADFYYTFHQPDSVLNVPFAVQELKKRYPSVSLNWQRILTTEKATDPQSPFIYKFKIPIHWTVNFPNSTQVPQFPNPQGLQFEDWLFQQKQLMTTLEKTDLPKNAFRWVFHTEGSAMKIYGVCQVVSILKPEKQAFY